MQSNGSMSVCVSIADMLTAGLYGASQQRHLQKAGEVVDMLMLSASGSLLKKLLRIARSV